jgi:hypothetical protein
MCVIAVGSLRCKRGLWCGLYVLGREVVTLVHVTHPGAPGWTQGSRVRLQVVAPDVCLASCVQMPCFMRVHAFGGLNVLWGRGFQ